MRYLHFHGKIPMNKILLTLFISTTALTTWAQHAQLQKMSAYVREIAAIASEAKSKPRLAPPGREPEVCTFMQINGNADSLLANYGGRVLAAFGDIYITTVPMSKLGDISDVEMIKRIEACQRAHALLDTTAARINATRAYAATDLTQPYTGAGVVVGVMDVGFDLTHPTFRYADGGGYKIARLWDQLASGDGQMYVGAQFSDTASIKTHQHSRDGLDETHGTHTAGIAAGGGAGSPYRGIAYGSELCLVSNSIGTSDDFIDSLNLYKYTNAADALGFKYIFDYAQSVGKPCVASFSEGYAVGFGDDDRLFYEVLRRMSGPGRIIVASAGNEGYYRNYLRKAATRRRTTIYPVQTSGNSILISLRASGPFFIQMVMGANSDTLTISSDSLDASLSTYKESVALSGESYDIRALATPTESGGKVYSLSLAGTPNDIGSDYPVSFSIAGKGADVELSCLSGELWRTKSGGTPSDAEPTHSVLAPGCAPAVICVGSTSWRQSYTNYLGEQKGTAAISSGMRSDFSSMGPAPADGTMKPDVAAPGYNVVSSYNSWYEEAHPSARDIDSDVEHFTYAGRTYAWNANTGTSMAAPAAAGAIALWLEADPTLTADDCRQVMAATCRQPDASLAYPNVEYGYGEIDAYRGLLEVLRRKSTGLARVIGKDDVSAFSVTQRGEEIVLSADHPTDRDFTISIYDTAGRLLSKRHEKRGATEYRISAAGMPKGVLIIKGSAAGSDLNGAKLLRLH